MQQREREERKGYARVCLGGQKSEMSVVLGSLRNCKFFLFFVFVLCPLEDVFGPSAGPTFLVDMIVHR